MTHLNYTPPNSAESTVLDCQRCLVQTEMHHCPTGTYMSWSELSFLSWEQDKAAVTYTGDILRAEQCYPSATTLCLEKS